MLTQGPEGPAQIRDIVATVYKSGPTLYVEPLPPQSLDCVRPVGAVGCKPTPSGFTAAPTSTGIGSSLWDIWRP